MRIIKPSASYMEHNVTPYEFIERVGRTCYKSEDKITEGSAEKFVKSLINSNHWAMLEHETVYIAMTKALMKDLLTLLVEKGENLAFFNITSDNLRGIHILSGSFRSFHDLFDKDYDIYPIRVLKYGLCSTYPLVFGEPEEVFPYSVLYGYVIYSREDFIKRFCNEKDILFKHLTHTVKFVCDRGVSHEMVRHRVASFAQESTRYCNYSRNKYGNELTVILPYFFYTEGLPYDLRFDSWKEACEKAEEMYFELLASNSKPEQARTVLPHSIKTDLIVTATEEWQHIVDLRLIGVTGAPHPQIKEVMALAIDDILKESEGRISYEAN